MPLTLFWVWATTPSVGPAHNYCETAGFASDCNAQILILNFENFRGNAPDPYSRVWTIAPLHRSHYITSILKPLPLALLECTDFNIKFWKYTYPQSGYMDYNGALRTLPHNPHSEITDFRLWLECTGLNIKFLKIWEGGAVLPNPIFRTSYSASLHTISHPHWENSGFACD